MQTIRYVMRGSVRGACAHQHRSLRGLAHCARQDAQGCRSQGGYSDRRPYAVVDGVLEPLTPQAYDTYMTVLTGEPHA